MTWDFTIDYFLKNAFHNYELRIVAWAAARRAVGTRKGEQLT